MKNRLKYAMKTSLLVRVSGSKQSQRRIEVSCIGLIRLVVCVIFTYVDRLVMKYLSASSCGEYLFICIKGLSINIFHLTVVYSDLGATPGYGRVKSELERTAA